jgi:hypothetical protein
LLSQQVDLEIIANSNMELGTATNLFN